VKVFQVSGLDRAGQQVVFATTDTAGLAINRLAEARVRYLRAWVSDEAGIDLSVPDLIARAADERQSNDQ
jgi:hypothetical protein